MRRSIVGVALAAALLGACGGGKAVSSTIEDASITAQVKTALLNDTEMNATRIDVSTANGVLYRTPFSPVPRLSYQMSTRPRFGEHEQDLMSRQG